MDSPQTPDPIDFASAIESQAQEQKEQQWKADVVSLLTEIRDSLAKPEAESPDNGKIIS